MHELRIANWDEFNDWCATRDGWAFRGERDASWALVSSLARRLEFCGVPRAEWREREERGMRIFRRKAHVYLGDAAVLRDDLRCLAMMQHHGAPTRLLDFTKSPFVAAFFALESAPGDARAFGRAAASGPPRRFSANSPNASAPWLAWSCSGPA